MGDIAEMMLDGTLCECCGCYIDGEGGDGIPRYCSAQCARDRGVSRPQRPKRAVAVQGGRKERRPPPELVMRKADEKWLLSASVDSGMYPGNHWDACTTAYQRLERLGLVYRYQPHNPVHKHRAVATEAGRAALAKIGEGRP